MALRRHSVRQLTDKFAAIMRDDLRFHGHEEVNTRWSEAADKGAGRTSRRQAARHARRLGCAGRLCRGGNHGYADGQLYGPAASNRSATKSLVGRILSRLSRPFFGQRLFVSIFCPHRAWRSGKALGPRYRGGMRFLGAPCYAVEVLVMAAGCVHSSGLTSIPKPGNSGTRIAPPLGKRGLISMAGQVDS